MAILVLITILNERHGASIQNNDQRNLAKDGITVASAPNRSFVFARWQHRTACFDWSSIPNIHFRRGQGPARLSVCAVQASGSNQIRPVHNTEPSFGSGFSQSFWEVLRLVCFRSYRRRQFSPMDDSTQWWHSWIWCSVTYVGRK